MIHAATYTSISGEKNVQEKVATTVSSPNFIAILHSRSRVITNVIYTVAVKNLNKMIDVPKKVMDEI